VPEELSRAKTLTRAQVADLTALGAKVEQHYGVPQDIEWGFDRGKWYLLQARPITTLSPEASATTVPGEFSRVMLAEIFPDALSPAFLSVVLPLFAGMFDFTFRTLGFEPAQDMEAVRAFYHQPYFSKAYIEQSLARLSPEVRETMVTQFINPISHEKIKSKRELSPAYLGMLARMVRFMIQFPNKLPNILSQYQAEIRQISELDLNSATEGEIIEHIRYLVFDAVGRLLNYDFLIIALTGRIYHLLESLLVPHYGAETATVVAKLNSGLPGNATMITNMRIWDLAQEARKSPWISDLLCTNEPEEFMTRLQENSAGRKFAEKLNAFLQEFGHREIRLDIIYPTWIEDPTPLLGFLRSYMDADDDQNPYKQHESLALAREALTQETLSRMQQGMKGRLLLAPFFRWILRQAQINTRERDTMHFEWTRLFSPARRMLRELGRRWLEKGWLNQVEDIYFVSFAEMEEMVHTPDDLREVVLERREVYAADCNRSWPDIIRDGQELFLSWNQPQDSLDGGLGGVAGSPGVVTGRCRIIKGPEDFGLLNKGEILVAPLTNPVWTPLFAIAGGVITEVGGILSHGAIVAREYGIPAVMAVPQATQILQDGQMISIDGNKGQVFILQEADS
jgi:pyruvate,water dikinase